MSPCGIFGVAYFTSPQTNSITQGISMRQLVICILCISALALTSISASARPKKRYDEKTKSCRVLNVGPLNWESLPWGQGGKGFKQVCKSCHNRDNEKNAPYLWEESKSSKGWNRIFATMRVKCARDGSWSTLSDEQLQMVNDYLYRWSNTSLSRDDSA